MRLTVLRARVRRSGKPKDDGERSVICDIEPMTATGSKEPASLDLDVPADRPNQKRLADLPSPSSLGQMAQQWQLWAGAGWLDVAPRHGHSDRWRSHGSMMDLLSRRAVGWSMKADRETSLVMDALMIAARRRAKACALLHHPDLGSQYTSEQFQRLLSDNGIICSMSRAGNFWDNPAMESFFSRLKTERTALKIHRTRHEARADIFDDIEHFYKPRRRRSKLGYLSLMKFEAQAMIAWPGVHETGSSPVRRSLSEAPIFHDVRRTPPALALSEQMFERAVTGCRDLGGDNALSAECTHTVVVGAGQAGVAMSEHLSAAGIPHVVLERGRIAESWRTRRWDSLVANGPAWHDRFPGLEFAGDPDAFVPKEGVAAYFEAYARMSGAPVRCGVEVTRVSRRRGAPGFLVETTEGPIEARAVVAATGPFQLPAIPPMVPDIVPVAQMHSSAYRNPGQLAPGGVIVIGAGSSGVQIADELNRAGRRVWLSVGPHGRPPRAYRGRDNVWWLGVLGKWDAQAPAPGADHITIAVSGARGGHTIDFRRLAAEGITLVGVTTGHDAGRLSFADDLAVNIAQGDANYLSLLDEADAYAADNGLDLPEEPSARRFLPMPACVTDPIGQLDLAAQGITTIIWATGFRSDYSWLPAGALDAQGRPVHTRGVSTERGIYFLGLPWLTGRGSSFIWGVWHDAKHVAGQIAIQRDYHAYAPQTAPGTARAAAAARG